MYSTNRHGSATYADGGSLSFTFADVGDLSIGPLGALQRELIPVMNRSDFAAWVEGPEQEIQFSFTFNLKGEAMVSASAARALDAIRWTGTWAAGTTTNPGGFGAKVGTFTYTLSVNGTTSRIPINYASLSTTYTEGTPNTMSVTGRGWLGTISAS